jgi:formylglycine-generating enzyme required for sulfatase activity
MSHRQSISRRDFLKWSGIAISAALLKACAPDAPTVTKVPPTPTFIPPTHTPTPTNTLLPTSTPTNQPVEAILPEMILVEAGSFQMGSVDGYADEQPVHTVHISRPFYIAKYEVTFEEYDRFCDDTLRSRLDDRGWGRGNQPIIHVDWYDATDYCNWLSEKEGLSPCYSGKGKFVECDFSANGYRLPTEAEWEYAARGGTKSQGFTYAGSDNLDEVGWYADNSNDRLQPVGQKLANELGLYDMCGNIFEWCWDWYGEDYYAASPASDPLGPPPPQSPNPWDFNRVRRSGSWREDAVNIRASVRSFDGPNYPGDNGFRLVRTA